VTISELDIEPMKRDELAEKILDIKREKGWAWKHITDETGDYRRFSWSAHYLDR
jgi:cyanate lyase